MCNCKSYNLEIGTVPEIVVKAPEWSGKETICLDHCIADSIQEMWLHGLMTLGSCCGHNKELPSVVIPNMIDPSPYHDFLEKEGRAWMVLQWQLRDTKTGRDYNSRPIAGLPAK